MPLRHPARQFPALPCAILGLIVALWPGGPGVGAQGPGAGGSRVAPTAPVSPQPSPGASAPAPSVIQVLPDLTIEWLKAMNGPTGANITVSVRNKGAKAGPSTLKIECAPFKVTMSPSVPNVVNSQPIYQPAPDYAASCFPTKTLSVPALGPGETHVASIGSTKCGLQQFRCEVTATVDASQQVKESDESNNQTKTHLPKP